MQNVEAVVIAASTGGPKALYKVITALPSDIGVPVLVVQHMPTGFTKAFADRLNLNSKIKVIEAKEGDYFLLGALGVYIIIKNMELKKHQDLFIKKSKEGTT